MEVRRIPADSTDARRLRAAMVDAIAEIYGEFVHGPGPSASDADFSPPGGGFVAIYADGRPIAGGGVKDLGGGTGELKRMYVAPDQRGRGVARVLLGALEDLARELGHSVLRLDTGRKQPHALALYQSAGYSEIDDYNANPYASYWAEKRL